MTVEVITGPTASGKTDLALRLAESDPTIEIVNADASLIYQDFDIGTAKPSKEVRSKVRHHLVDILRFDQPFSAADYSNTARLTIREIVARGRRPLVVGGTGFYIEALFTGLIPIDATAEEIAVAKERANREIAQFGFDAMHERLRAVDPDLYRQIQRERNPIRLHRAWEHFYATGISLGEARKQRPEPFEYSPSFTVLEVEREELRHRIAIRTDAMIAAGWIEEVRSLIAQGVTSAMPAMKAIGYREIYQVATGALPLEEARERIIFRTRQYAKRQTTWMKRYK